VAGGVVVLGGLNVPVGVALAGGVAVPEDVALPGATGLPFAGRLLWDVGSSLASDLLAARVSAKFSWERRLLWPG
jgi:hypothetical protein